MDECGVCRAFVQETRPHPLCRVCSERTCHNCQRVCDRCLQAICMKHIGLRKVVFNSSNSLFKLCDVCKDVWKGNVT